MPAAAEKGVRHLLPERPGGCCAQKVPDPFFAAMMTFASSAALALGGMKLLDRFLESLPLDKAHGIKGTAVRVLADRVDRDNAGMFQPAGNLGLAEKAVATLRIAGVQRTQTFQRDGQAPSFEDVRAEIVHAVTAEKRRALIEEWVGSLRRRADVIDLYLLPVR